MGYTQLLPTLVAPRIFSLSLIMAILLLEELQIIPVKKVLILLIWDVELIMELEGLIEFTLVREFQKPLQRLVLIAVLIVL